MEKALDLDWSNLSFGYMKADYNVRCYYRNGEWGEVEVSDSEHITLHMAATCLHYGQEAFEGLKAFRGKDGKVRIFRPEENAKRLQRSAAYLGIEAPSVEMFVDMCKQVVKENIDFLPPYEVTGASMYIRPTLIGSNPQLGVQSSKECTFLMLCAPVGAYNTPLPDYTGLRATTGPAGYIFCILLPLPGNCRSRMPC